MSTKTAIAGGLTALLLTAFPAASAHAAPAPACAGAPDETGATAQDEKPVERRTAWPDPEDEDALV
jgi:hypothetical protein